MKTLKQFRDEQIALTELRLPKLTPLLFRSSPRIIQSTNKLKKLSVAVLTALGLHGCALAPMETAFETGVNIGNMINHELSQASLNSEWYSRWLSFCRTYDNQCNELAGKSIVSFEDAAKVNDTINKKLVYNKYGNNWYNLGESGSGQCITYALAKRAELRKLGYASDSMSTLTLNNNEHAVLLVKTNKGDYLLDNRYGSPVQIGNTDYKGKVSHIEIDNKWYTVIEPELKLHECITRKIKAYRV